MIDKVLKICGVSYKMSGYKVLRRLIEIKIEDDSSLQPHKRLYDEIAKESKCTRSATEKNARIALQRAWNTNADDINKIMYRDDFTAPTVMDFTSEVARWVLQHKHR